MRIAVIVTGVLRNFEIAMSNWQWPPSCEIDYYLVTWSKTLQSYQLYSSQTPTSAMADIDRAMEILPFKQVSVLNYDALPIGIPSRFRMLYLWKHAAKLADMMPEYDSFIIVRPELIMIPYGDLIDSDKEFLDTTDAFIAQCSFEDYSHAGDQILIFGKRHIPHIERMYEDLVQSDVLDIHTFMNNTFRKMRDEHGVTFKDFPHNKWFYMISRRPGFPGNLNQHLFEVEKSFIEWFTTVQLGGENVFINLDVSRLRFLNQ